MCHSRPRLRGDKLRRESSLFNSFWTPAFAGVTIYGEIRLFTEASKHVLVCKQLWGKFSLKSRNKSFFTHPAGSFHVAAGVALQDPAGHRHLVDLVEAVVDPRENRGHFPD